MSPTERPTLAPYLFDQFQWHRQIIRARALTPTMRLVALALWDYADADGEDIYPGRTRLADDLGLSLSTVDRALASLRESGWIDRVTRGSSSGTRNIADVYRLTTPSQDHSSPVTTAPVDHSSLVRTPLVTHDDYHSSLMRQPLSTGDDLTAHEQPIEQPIEQPSGSGTVGDSLASKEFFGEEKRERPALNGGFGEFDVSPAEVDQWLSPGPAGAGGFETVDPHTDPWSGNPLPRGPVVNGGFGTQVVTEKSAEEEELDPWSGQPASETYGGFGDSLSA